MNNQEFFNKCVAHLRQQKAKALVDDSCVYEMPSTGRRCAIGGVMSPDLLATIKAKQLNTGCGIYSLLQSLPEAREFFAGVNHELLRAMQAVHDELPIYTWDNRCRSIALVYNLEMPA